MRLIATLDKLYAAIPLDTTLRTGALITVIQEHPKEFALLYSVAQLVKLGHPEFNTHVPTNVEFSIMLRQLLLDRPTRLNHQYVIVLKALTNGVFPETVMLEHIERIHNKAQLLAILEPTPQTEEKLPFAIVAGGVYYTYRGQGTRVTSSITKAALRPHVNKHTCVITTEGGMVLAQGGHGLLRYARDSHALPEDTQFFCDSITERNLQKLLQETKGKTIVVFRKEHLHVIQRDAEVEELAPVDWLLDASYRPIGFIFNIEGTVTKVKHKVARKVEAAGLDSIVCTVSYKRTKGKVTRPTIEGIKIKDTNG